MDFGTPFCHYSDIRKGIMKNTEGRYELNFFSEWEDTVLEGRFDTVDECYDRLNNIGSKWVLYPNCFIFDTEEQEMVTVFFED